MTKYARAPRAGAQPQARNRIISCVLKPIT